MTTFRAEAAAKVNLALAVTGLREDGYHRLRSVFLRLALHDALEVQLDAQAGADSLAIDGDLAVSADNLVLRAAAHLREALDPRLPALRFRLVKRIPAAAGLGGGSADAAVAMDLALQAWGLRLHPARRLDTALHLGADVPFFAAGHAASIVEGIGEHLVPLPAPEPPAGLLLITPSARLSTADVFAEFDRVAAVGTVADERVTEVAELLREGIDGMTLAATTAMLREANDLWAPAARLSPGLRAMREAGERRLGRALLLTGSGPTLFAVYPSEAAATREAIALQADPPSELDGADIMTTSTVGTEGDS